MQYIQEITLDIHQHGYVSINAKQGDQNGRFIRIHLTNNGEEIKLVDGESVEFRALKPDGKSVDNPATIEDDGTILACLTDQTLAVDGEVIADIAIKQGADVVSTLNFVIDVQQAPLGKDIPSTNEFGALNQATVDASAAAGEARKAAGDADTAAGEANTAAGKANTAASGADASAKKADASAKKADTAAAGANAAAGRVDDAIAEADAATDEALDAAEQARQAAQSVIEQIDGVIVLNMDTGEKNIARFRVKDGHPAILEAELQPTV